MDNQTPPTSNDNNNSPPNQAVTRSENDPQDTDILAYLDGLVRAAIKRQQAKQKKKPTSTFEVVFEGEAVLIDLAVLNLFDVPYYVDPNPPIALPDERD